MACLVGHSGTLGEGGEERVLIKDTFVCVGVVLTFCSCVYPTTNGGMQNGSSVGIYTHCKYVFCTFGTDSYAQSVLINKISASDLSRKLIKSALLVGQAVTNCNR